MCEQVGLWFLFLLLGLFSFCCFAFPTLMVFSYHFILKNKWIKNILNIVIIRIQNEREKKMYSAFHNIYIFPIAPQLGLRLCFPRALFGCTCMSLGYMCSVRFPYEFLKRSLQLLFPLVTGPPFSYFKLILPIP